MIDGLGRDQVGIVAQAAVDFLRELMVFRTVGRAPVVEADMKAIQMLLPARRDARDEFLRRDICLLGSDHDRRAMRIVGADEMHLMALHALIADPDIGLDVLHDVADMEGRIGVGQGSGHEKLSRCRVAHRGMLSVGKGLQKRDFSSAAGFGRLISAWPAAPAGWIRQGGGHLAR